MLSLDHCAKSVHLLCVHMHKLGSSHLNVAHIAVGTDTVWQQMGVTLISSYHI